MGLFSSFLLFLVHEQEGILPAKVVGFGGHDVGLQIRTFFVSGHEQQIFLPDFPNTI